MASASTLEWVIGQLRILNGDLEDQQRRIGAYANGVDDAISTPITSDLVSEAGGWVGAIQRAQDAVSYWIYDIQRELDSLE